MQYPKKKNGEDSLWKVRENQEKFMDAVGMNLGFRSKVDWYSLTHADIGKFGGDLLLKHYKGKPISTILTSIYPGASQ